LWRLDFDIRFNFASVPDPVFVILCKDKGFLTIVAVWIKFLKKKKKRLDKGG